MILSGRDLQWYIERKKLIIDPINENTFQQNGVDLILEDVDLHVGEDGKKHFGWHGFTLGVTREVIELPDDLMAFVCLRSSMARKGLIIPPTVVDAGFKGSLTIEIMYDKPRMGYLNNCAPLGERFIHLIFAKTTSPCVPYEGKYQNQAGITVSIDDKKS